MAQRRRDAETDRQRDRGTEGQRDRGTERWERIFFPSPHPSVSPPLRFSFSMSLLLSIPLYLCVSVSGSIQKGSFEKQALSSTREMSASELDGALPKRVFAQWFNELVGPNAGVVWQLTECGEQTGVPGQPEYDMPACAEINAVLPDGRRIFVAISVGTFKKGLIGKPAFFRAVIEQNEQFRQVPRLRDLPKMLRAQTDLSADLSATVTKNRIVDLPQIKKDSGLVPAHFHSTTPPPSGFLPGAGASSQSEEPPPPPPSSQTLEIVPESVSQSRAISRVKPDYPPTARKMNATGTVQVEIIISEAGLVLEATPIGGHLALRNAAVEAARKWIFEPATLYGEPVKVKSVLTFVFTPSAK
jgi:TonB family protein